MSANSRVKLSYQGVEYEFFDETRKNLEDLVCPICQEILSDPLITSCGHLFCRRCLEKHGRDFKDCPVCRQTYTSMSDQFHARKIGGLRVKCRNASKGCKWRGELKDAKGHVGSTSCQYVDVLCKNGCGARLQRSVIVDHETKQCPKRHYICPHCGEEGTFDVIESSHYTVCTDLPIPCPTGCSMEVPRNRLLSHLGVCYRRPVKCKYRQIGCPAILEAKDMEEHLKTQKDAHLELSMDAVVKLTTCVSQLQLVHNSPAVSAQQLAGAMVPLARPWLETPSALPFPPRIIKLDGYAEKAANNHIWYSEPFFTHPGGYEMCLQVHTNGFKTAQGQHLSVYTCLMRGNMDHILKWPLSGNVSMYLLNQLEDNNHIRFSAVYHGQGDDESRVSYRVLPPKSRSSGRGRRKLVALSSLTHPATPSVKYLVDDCLYFKIDSAEVNA